MGKCKSKWKREGKGREVTWRKEEENNIKEGNSKPAQLVPAC